MNTYQKTHKLSKLVLLMVTVSLLSSCRQAQKSADTNTAQGIPVKIATVENRMIDISDEFAAQLESRKSLELQPRVDGQVSKIFVKPGQKVNAGTVIMQIDQAKQQVSTQSDAAATSARADWENAKAALKNYQVERLTKAADLKFNRDQYSRYNNLYSEGAISKLERDQYANMMATNQANIEAIDARIEAQKTAIARAQKSLQEAQANTKDKKEQLNYFMIAAPFAGTIGKIPVKVGEFVNTSKQLATLTQNDSFEVNINIPVEKVAKVRLGTPVELINQNNQKVATTRVSFISPKTAENPQLTLVKAVIPNSTGQLRTDQSYKARVIWEQRPSVLVPIIAVSHIAAQNFVFVAEQGKSGQVARQRPVKLGIMQDNNYQVIDGLNQGEKIVTTGLQKLSDGAAISPE